MILNERLVTSISVSHRLRQYQRREMPLPALVHSAGGSRIGRRYSTRHGITPAP